MIVGGPRTMDCTWAAVTGSTVIVDIAVPLSVAVICAAVCEGTVSVVIVKVPETAPGGIVRVGVETVATCVFELERATVTPPVGTIEDSMTVPTDVPLTPPWTSAGERETAVTLGGGGGSWPEDDPGMPEQAIASELRAATSKPGKTRPPGRIFFASDRREELCACWSRFGIDLSGIRGPGLKRRTPKIQPPKNLRRERRRGPCIQNAKVPSISHPAANPSIPEK